MESDLVKGTPLPLLGFREPERLTLGIMIRTLSAKILLAANFSELVHELHSLVKPSHGLTIADSAQVKIRPLVAPEDVNILPARDHRAATRAIMRPLPIAAKTTCRWPTAQFLLQSNINKLYASYSYVITSGFGAKLTMLPFVGRLGLGYIAFRDISIKESLERTIRGRTP